MGVKIKVVPYKVDLKDRKMMFLMLVGFCQKPIPTGLIVKYHSFLETIKD